jgi:hypothetical protein
MQIRPLEPADRRAALAHRDLAISTLAAEQARGPRWLEKLRELHGRRQVDKRVGVAADTPDPTLPEAA